MYIDRKVSVWVRDYYDSKKVSIQDLVNDPNIEDGFLETEILFETMESQLNDDDEEIVEIFDDNDEKYDPKS